MERLGGEQELDEVDRSGSERRLKEAGVGIARVAVDVRRTRRRSTPTSGASGCPGRGRNAAKSSTRSILPVQVSGTDNEIGTTN